METDQQMSNRAIAGRVSRVWMVLGVLGIFWAFGCDRYGDDAIAENRGSLCPAGNTLSMSAEYQELYTYGPKRANPLRSGVVTVILKNTHEELSVELGRSEDAFCVSSTGTVTRLGKTALLKILNCWPESIGPLQEASFQFPLEGTLLPYDLSALGGDICIAIVVLRRNQLEIVNIPVSHFHSASDMEEGD